MPSDYEAITKENIRRLGEDTDQYKPLINLYANPTHFIYELLQNADDYGATTVSFDLSCDALLLEHDGTPFSEQNVKAISNIGKSTSADDHTKTGCFGLGFKSVFAFTATPRIVSGEESFEIHSLSRVRAFPCPENWDDSKTRIILPFNHVDIQPDYVDRIRSPEESHQDIGQKLRDIGLRTLLFTKSISEVKWSIGADSGHYLKEVRRDHVYLTDGYGEETYLVFQEPVEWEGTKLNPVSIAFLMKQGRIVEVPNRSLFVLFETALETHLGFLVNGAFRTTPSRENIRYEDALNQYLIRKLADLLETCFGKLKAAGLLDTSLLQCLPTKIDNKGSSYYPDWKPDYPEQWPFMPLYDQVKECCINSDYLPADQSGEYSNAGNALLARGEELRDLFPNDVSGCIWGDDKVWLSGEITADKTPELRQYLIHELEIREIAPQDVLGALTESLFFRQPLAWLVSFYLYVAEEYSRKYEVRRKNVPCIPLESGEWVGAETSTVVFAADGVPDSCKTSVLLPNVKNEAGDQWGVVKGLLEFLGVHEFNQEDEVRFILDIYYSSAANQKVSLGCHLDHMRLFISFWKDDENTAKRLLGDASIFIVDQHPGIIFEEGGLYEDSGIECFLYAEQCYIDQPLLTTFLTDVLGSGEGQTRKTLSHCYAGLGKDFIGFAVSLGVLASIKPEKCPAENNPRIEKKGRWGTVCYNEDCCLPQFIDKILHERPSVENYDRKFNAAHLVWSMMCDLEPRNFKARLQPNSNHETYSEAPARLLQQLTEYAWLMGNDEGSGWRRPCDLTEETLYTGATKEEPAPIFDIAEATNGWLKMVGFGQSEEMKTAFKNSGENYDEYLLFKELKEKMPASLNQLIKEVQSVEQVESNAVNYAEGLRDGFNKPGQADLNEEYAEEDDSFSTPAKYPERRAEKLAADVMERKENEPPATDRKMIRLSKTVECKDQQTRESIRQWYKGKCQICDETWPKRDGKPYFVAAYLIEHKQGRWIDDPGNVMCLCAKHFAQWRHASKQQCYDIPEWIMAQKSSKEGEVFPLSLEFELLGKKVGIKYREDHFLALRSMLENNHHQL